ncbi:ABC transporter permease [Gordonia sp. HY285]|uniref:ABC transporter permease n=1 Tax=Gordonia liuliyuniae TaxID=2911517 RepID=UPI001F1F4415|nr:ABC transporter permease [Gordonia liuliyuniae]MCF8609987.1 ABC transporter permease [Gordonia liuliyuniae]
MTGVNRNAVAVLVGLEVRQRIRSTRWKVTAGLLFALTSVLVLGSLYLTVAVAGESYRDWASNLLDITLAVVLFLGFAAAPTLSATSINGDRRDATLALVQAAPISSWDLALGKLLGSWFASLALIGVALPYLIWGAVSSHTSILFAILAMIVTAAIMGAYCAIGLAFSSLTSRPAASAMLTQATVLLLLLGSPIAFGLTYPMTQQNHRVTVAGWDFDDATSEANCRLDEREERFNHTEYTWWLLAPNPVLIVSDVVSAGIDRPDDSPFVGGAGFFAFLQSAARAGPDVRSEGCDALTTPGLSGDDERLARHVGDSWYIGLAVTVVIGCASLAVAARRLRVPAHKLGRGVRVA